MDSRLRDQTEHAFREHGNIDAALATLMGIDPADPTCSTTGNAR